LRIASKGSVKSRVAEASRECRKCAVAVFKQALISFSKKYGRSLDTTHSGFRRSVSGLSSPSVLSGHLTFFTEPKLKVDTKIFGPKRVVIRHLTGQFEVRFYGIVFRNSRSRRSKAANHCRVLIGDAGYRITPIFWLNPRHDRNYSIPYSFDTGSSEVERRVMQALIDMEFCTRETDIRRGMHEIAFVAFGLEIDKKCYLAMNPPAELASTSEGRKVAFYPFHVMIEGEEIAPVESNVAVAYPGDWDSFRIVFAKRLGFFRVRRKPTSVGDKA